MCGSNVMIGKRNDVPQALGGFVTTVLSGQIVARTGRYKPVVIVGAVGALISCVLLRGLNTETTPLWLAAILLVAMCGFAIVAGSLQTLVIRCRILRQGRWVDVLGPLQVAHHQRPLVLVRRRQGESAVAHHRGGHAMPARAKFIILTSFSVGHVWGSVRRDKPGYIMV